MRIQFDRFPGGRSKALTLSYDDGRIHDRRLVGILNEYGIKGTFHLNSGFFGRDGYIITEEVRALYAGHEVSAHTATHPFLELTPRERVVTELMEDRRALERTVGYPVRGMSYPFGTYNRDVTQLLPMLGIKYARTTVSTGRFSLPDDFLQWHPTCHHRAMIEHGEAFLNEKPKYNRMQLLYVWGHSYEFDNNGNWEDMETFCRLVSGRDDIWYATNIEIVDYMEALKRLEFSVDETMVRNPSAIPVWIGVDGRPVELAPGGVTRLTDENDG